MAFDISGKPYSDASIIRSVYDINNNALKIKNVDPSDVVYIELHDYASVNVTTGAYVELIASTVAEAVQLEITDTSTQLLVLAFGAAASEVDTLYIPPGGNGLVNIVVPIGTRLSIKAISGNATTGYLAINAYS